MRNGFYIICIIITLSSCKDNNVNVFDKTADERVTDAVASLKADLVAPTNGFRIKYRPDQTSGSFYMLLKFNEDNSLIIQSDAAANNGEFVMDTITYRIDSSLGLQLILQNFSVFSFLFEQNDASFPAEYQFKYVNKTPDGSLVFKSKTDPSNPTIITFEKAISTDTELLGVTVGKNLALQAKELDPKITSSFQLVYQNKDLIFYLSLDQLKRVVTITSASKKTNTLTTKTVDFTSGYTLKGDSIVFDTLLKGSFLNTTISLKGIKFSTLTDDVINVCAAPIPIHAYNGVTSGNQVVILESSLLDPSGKEFATLSNTYFSPLEFIFNNGVSASTAITNDIPGAVEFDLYYNVKLKDGTTLNGIGFILKRADGSYTFALKEFDPVLNSNNIVFNFKPGFRYFYGTDTTEPPSTTLDNIDVYLNYLTQGDQTYVTKLIDNRYEFYNPCTGWSFVFVNANQ